MMLAWSLMRKVLPLQYDRLGKSTVLADDTKNGGTEQLDRQLFDPRDAFDTVTRELCACPAEELVDAASLVQAVLDNDMLVAETSWVAEDGSYAVQLTYPIRTVNCNEVSTTAWTARVFSITALLTPLVPRSSATSSSSPTLGPCSVFRSSMEMSRPRNCWAKLRSLRSLPGTPGAGSSARRPRWTRRPSFSSVGRRRLHARRSAAGRLRSTITRKRCGCRQRIGCSASRAGGRVCESAVCLRLC